MTDAVRRALEFAAEHMHSDWPERCQEIVRRARAALSEQPAPRVCKGIPRVGCNYLAECDSVCNKCGKVHAVHLIPGVGSTAPVERVALSVTDDMVSRFLSWPLPRDFYPDCGISFDGRRDDEWNKNKTWPIGTNLLTAIQARQMLEHVLTEPVAAPHVKTAAEMRYDAAHDTVQIDYTVLHKYATEQELSYSELCATVRAALRTK